MNLNTAVSPLFVVYFLFYKLCWIGFNWGMALPLVCNHSDSVCSFCFHPLAVQAQRQHRHVTCVGSGFCEPPGGVLPWRCVHQHSGGVNLSSCALVLYLLPLLWQEREPQCGFTVGFVSLFDSPGWFDQSGAKILCSFPRFHPLQPWLHKTKIP